MTDGPRGAVTDALAELGDGLDRALEQAEQLAFLPIEPEASTRLTTDGGERVRASVAAARRGRPAGAQNLATRQVKEFCRRVFGIDPLVEGFRWAQHTPASLALELGCTRAEAWDRLEALRRDLCRYFYAPMVAVDEDGRPAPVFQMTIGGAPGGSSSPDLPPWKYLENQAVDVTPRDVSHAPVSHGQAK
jgi:hypothetical protein